MIHKSTIQLLRFKFSIFLMPVYWFALSFVENIHWQNAIIIGVILHLLIYPSSYGYNSYMDRDVDSIGGVKTPLSPTKQLFYASVALDVAGVLSSFIISNSFAFCVGVYIVFSRLYSYRKVRLKRFPILGYLTVILNQGGLIFLAIYQGASLQFNTTVPWLGVVISCFLIGGFYPITQVYQHQQDKQDGVKTISMLLGIMGTFYFCIFMYSVAFILLIFNYTLLLHETTSLIILQISYLPIIFYFLQWALKVYKDEKEANFNNTMKMNWIASAFSNLAFIVIILTKIF